jgi:hypothetical protein
VSLERHGTILRRPSPPRNPVSREGLGGPSGAGTPDFLALGNPAKEDHYATLA